LVHTIKIRQATQNNLKNISLEIPHHKLIAVTGVSGSGKSSLAFDIIAQEGRRQYLQTIPSFARQFSGKLEKPAVEEITGLFPVISIGQEKTSASDSSTFGTLSNLYDYLRLLFARFGQTTENINLSRSLFSFNSSLGACPQCKGLGVEEHISVDKLVADVSKTLREGALVPTQPNGYIMYSQVTVDVLDTVCRQHGFSVDIPWKDLSEAQKNVILNGSTKIKVPFGKHSLESRLKWKALKAKPREEGYYKGMLPIMEDILRRDRNKNILRFAETQPCSVCHGSRLNKQALSVTWSQKSIDVLSAYTLFDLKIFFETITPTHKAEKKIQTHILRELDLYNRLGMGHLSLHLPAKQLTTGERQRIRLVNQLSTGLSNVLYVFDEPTIGMHPKDTYALIEIMRSLVNNGNTVIVVEHDLDVIRQADHIIELGPKAGIDGGQILFNDTATHFFSAIPKTPTQKALQENDTPNIPTEKNDSLKLKNCFSKETILFKKSAINVICGLPGSGKKYLTETCLLPQLTHYSYIDQSPIGRTPRSNTATYTGLANHIRDLFASLPKAKAVKFTKSHFSFNTKGGRCEHCQGAGKIQIGMHYMGNVDIVCEKCNGKRFKEEILGITYRNKTIADIYELSIREALAFFDDMPVIRQYLEILNRLGLGYLKIGQPSTTLSGGEAQRIKLATALVKQRNNNHWYVLNNPTTGLHHTDTKHLITALHDLTKKGHSIVCIEHQKQFLQAADHIIELELNKTSSAVVFQGHWNDFIQHPSSPTATAYRTKINSQSAKNKIITTKTISIKNCTTNNLKGIDINIPKNKLTIITGLSGSGKSSLAFDTLFSEAQSRISESLSVYSRSFIKQANHAQADSFEHLTPAIAITRKNKPFTPRSTVGTQTRIYEAYRFLFSRLAQQNGLPLTARHFSFNHENGLCLQCSGLGFLQKADRDKLVPDKTKTIADGALTHNSIIRYYGHPDSQYAAILNTVAKEYNIDLNKPFSAFTNDELNIIFDGTGDKIWETDWTYKTKTTTGTQHIAMSWKGFGGLLEEEYHRSEHTKHFGKLQAMMHEETCPLCRGSRLNKQALSIYFNDKNIAELSALNIAETKQFFESYLADNKDDIASFIYDTIKPDLNYLLKLRLGHLSIDRRSSTLSDGEAQRLQLAQQLSGSLQGITYVLDEPSMGLHQTNINDLLEIIFELKNKGNTIVIVEHNKQIIEQADHIIEIGPKAGTQGGKIIAQGSLFDFMKNEKAITPAYLKKTVFENPVKTNLQPNAFGFFGVNIYNLKNRDFHFSANGIIAITGVSGIGKSTLMHKVIFPTLTQQKPVNTQSFYDHANFSQILEITQNPVFNHTRLSTVFSHTGLMDILAKLFASVELSRHQKLKPSVFKYTSKDGRCTHCNGNGETNINMDFMDEVWTPCEVCHGKRYNTISHNIKINEKSIADLLQFSVSELEKFLIDIPAKYSQEALSVIQELTALGMGYLKLGQTVSSLSGGETQRLQMAMALVHADKTKADKQLFLLDEPSSGLHFADLDRLIQVFNRLIKNGHTVMFIEHNPYLINVAHQEIAL